MIVVGLVAIYLVAFGALWAIAKSWFGWRRPLGRLSLGRTTLLAAVAYGTSLAIFYYLAPSGVFLSIYAHIGISLAIGLLGLRLLVVDDVSTTI